MKNPHPTVKPIKLMSYLITLASRENDVVLDPFCGSGTTCVAAKLLNRRYIGIEISPEYHQIAVRRIESVEPIKKATTANASELRIAGRTGKANTRENTEPTETKEFNPVHFMSESVEWPTPRGVFRQLDREFGFTLDPCATRENAKCARYFTKTDDGLKQDWSGEVVFMNPPYGREIDRWMKKAYQSSLQGATVVCLVPARTDTKWWHQWAMRGEIRLLKGRLRFGNAKHSAPFPSAIVVFKSLKAKEMKVAA
jgi:site-specific DNA-methyltransferase (adenine-specific)